MTTPLLKKDGRNRALRSFLSGLGVTVLTAFVLVLYPVVTSAKSWGDFDWPLLTFSLFQAVLTAIFAYLMRTVLDGSKLPTPLPPAPQPEPADGPGEGGFADLELALLVAILVGVLLLLFRVHFGG